MNRPITATARPATLLAALWPDSSLARNVAIAIVGSLMLALSAKVQVPGPVPMTMQTLVVLVLGAALGARLGAATVLLYLAEGAMGLPVFADTPAKGIGLAYMMGTTGGYLVGFVVAAYVVGLLAERGWDRSVLRLLAVMTLGHVLILACGFAWLATLIGPEKAWVFGIVPFIAATVLKTALGALALPAAWKAIAR